MRTKYILIAAVLIFCFWLTGCFSYNNLSLLPSEDGTLKTKLVMKARGRTDDKILILDIDGVITEWGDSSFFGVTEPTTFRIRQKLEYAIKDQNIKAVILRVNSPGGSVNASDIIYKELLDYKNTAKIPMVTIMMGVAASGGYYVSCATDRIVAHPNTVTASIGVISYGLGFSGLFEKIGMESRVIKSGPMKDMGNPFDVWTEEEKAATQRIVDNMFDKFVKVVATGRNMKEPDVRKIADGRVLVADDALKAKLIDKIGYMNDAISEAMSLARIDDANIIIYSPNELADRNIYTQAQSAQINLPDLTAGSISAEKILELARPRLMYLWLGY